MRISAIFYFRSKMFVLELKTAKRGKVALGGPRLGNRETGQARAEVVEQGPEVLPVPVCGSCGFLVPNGWFIKSKPAQTDKVRSVLALLHWEPPFLVCVLGFFCLFKISRKPHPENID